MIVMRRLSHALPHSDSYDCHVTLLEAHYCRYAAAVYTVPLMLMGSLTGPLLSPSASSSGPGGTTPLALSSGDLTLSRSFPLAFTRSEGERRILNGERGGRERREREEGERGGRKRREREEGERGKKTAVRWV